VKKNGQRQLHRGVSLDRHDLQRAAHHAGAGDGQFRQTLSLDPSWMPSGARLSKVDPKMVGPITGSDDLLRGPVDYKQGWILQHAGDHFYVPNPQVSSWADGTQVIVGKDQIDFDLNIQSIDPVKQTAVVVVHHVPPATSQSAASGGLDAGSRWPTRRTTGWK
jgi:hypothetical protein